MWFKKLKKKKLQCFLIGILLFLSSLIFASSLSMITSINGYVNKYYANEKLYDVILFDSNEAATQDILKWCKENSDVKDVKVIDAFTSGNDLYLNSKNIKLPFYSIVPLENMRNVPSGLNKVKSLDNSSYPKEGEVWITQLLADNFHIALGDNLTFKIKDKQVTLKVSSLINDSLQPASTSDQILLYTNINSAQQFSSFTKAPTIFIDIKKGASASDIEKSLINAVRVGGFTLDKSKLVDSSIMVSSTIGGICTLASLLVFIVSVLLIRFILWNSILKEYKSIGIYKALGFLKREILKFYIMGYSLTAIIGSTLGAIISIPVINYTASKVLKYIGDFDGVNVNFSVILTTIALFSVVVIINLYLVIRRTNKISPVDAFKTGITSSRKKLTKSLIKNTISPLALAVNDMFKYKKISALITLTLSLALTLVLMFGNFNVTISKMKDHTNVWFGLPKSNVTISAPLFTREGITKDVINQVKNDNRVKNYVYGSLAFTGLKLDNKKYPIKGTLDTVLVMSSYDKDLGFTIVDGRNPENYKEVAVSMKILQDTGLAVGDNIELTINDKKDSYLICGSYNSLMNNGYGMKLLTSTVQKEIPDYIGTELFVNLKDASEIGSFEKDINNKFPSLDTSELHPLLKYSIDPIAGTFLPVTYLLIVVFIAFGAITILNIIVMNIRDNTRNFGVMKALGFTSKEISLRYLYRILILTLFSTILAVILNLTAARPMIAASVNKLDILVISPSTMAAIITAMIILITSIALIGCSVIKNTKPTELMEE
ncbi:MAG: FtsX-like permease family protein [Bacillota bacterium]|nr:FtsX-like permease family protein [Bacillota bacterium]